MFAHYIKLIILFVHAILLCNYFTYICFVFIIYQRSSLPILNLRKEYEMANVRPIIFLGDAFDGYGS